MPSPTPPAVPVNPGLAEARDERARLDTEIQSMQAVLVRLLQDVVDAETTLSDTTSAQLVEANEQLVVAALASQERADTVSQALEVITQAPALDALTHLPTRSTLYDRFGQALAQARRQNQGLALLFVDLDDFKPLNDRFGHAFGDHVLCQVAERLESAVREGDTVSRYGGDEFLILLAGVVSPTDAQAVADKLAATLAMPMRVEGRTLRLSASIGVARYPNDGDDLDTLTAQADAAMYASKQQRRRAGDPAAGAPGADPARAQNGSAQAQTPTETQPDAPRPGPTTMDEAGSRLLELSDLREANEKLVLAAIGAQELQAAAESALRRQGQFIQAVADELRNPAAPVHVAATMLGRQPGAEPLLPRVQALVEQRLARMAQRVASLVEVAAAETGSLVLRRREVALAALVDAAATLCEPLLRRRRQRLNWQRPPTPIRLLADPARLKLALSNLLDSACSHTSMGGTITVNLLAEGDHAVLRIDDEGIGIPASMLPHVFDPFVMDEHALDIQGASLGIGLTVAHALVKAHGGTLEAHNVGPGRGNRFVLTLPTRTAAACGGPDDPRTQASADAWADTNSAANSRDSPTDAPTPP